MPTKRLVKGTPQGCVLSPVVWNIAFDDLLDLFDDHPVDILGCADDASVVVCGHNPSIMVDLMQDALDWALAWGPTVSLSCSAQKTAVMVFMHKRGGTVDFSQLVMGGLPLPYSSQVKYLGILLDAKLTFWVHVQAKSQKAIRMLHAFGEAVGRLWGPLVKVMGWTYEQVV